MNDPRSSHSPPADGADQRPAAGQAGAGKKLRVKLVKSINSCKQHHRDTVRGLGLKWREHTVEVEDTPAIRGMINKVSYLVKVVEGDERQARA